MTRQKTSGIVRLDQRQNGERQKVMSTDVKHGQESDSFDELRKFYGQEMLSFEEANEILMRNEKFSMLVNSLNASSAPAKIVKNLRLSLGWSQKKMAEEVGLSQARISMIEAGATKEGISISTLSRIVESCDHVIQIVVRGGPRDISRKKR